MMISNLVSYGGFGRRIPVPDRLPYPALDLDRTVNILNNRIRDGFIRVPRVTHRSLGDLACLRDDPRLIHRSIKAFDDDLIQLLPPRTEPPDYSQAIDRSFHEAVASMTLTRTLLSRVEIPRTLELIVSIRNFLALPSAFREGGVSTMPDRFNNVVDYPAPALVHSLLDELDCFRLKYTLGFPYCTAVVTFVAIVHAHPFNDGNGRTARTALNVLTSIAAGRMVALPLAIISLLTNGGFILKLRRAMHGGEWTGLFHFLAEAGCLFAETDSPH